MKSFGEYFSSLLNMNMFCKDESKESTHSLDKTVHEKEEVQEIKSENSKIEEKKEEHKESKKKGEETFEFIEIAESSFDEEVEDMFITKF